MSTAGAGSKANEDKWSCFSYRSILARWTRRSFRSSERVERTKGSGGGWQTDKVTYVVLECNYVAATSFRIVDSELIPSAM